MTAADEGAARAAVDPERAPDRPVDRAAGRGAVPRKDAAARPARRGPADPVRVLMHRHRKLCAHAVDPLEIAAGLEAHGVTDRTAARFRHRDVFSLAEELYARVPRAESDGTGSDTGTDRGTGTGSGPGAGAGSWSGAWADAADGPGAGAAGRPDRAPAPRWGAAPQLLPGAVCVTTVTALASAAGHGATPLLRLAVGVVGAVLLGLAVRLALRTGPLRAHHPGSRTTGLWTCWTVGYAVYGDWLLGRLPAGGPDLPYAPPQAVVAPVVALSLAILPAAGCARWFADRGQRRLAASRGLAEFAARVRPLLLTAALLFLGALTALLLAAGAVLGTGDGGALTLVAAAALGLLLFLARLLTVHGFPEAASAGLASAAALEGLALGLVLTARLPGLAPLGVPVEALTTTAGPAAVPAVACTAAALGLLGYGLRALTGACAHAPAPAGPGNPAGAGKAHRP
ncbi:integral membrane protein MviN [Streptomyces sp. NBRC 110611]|uniref:hypothetical protein n=1 Tax=Streptomyces sp. NBRC 110611 TaxID=1621259 RepID=UPI0008364664|nr:hypothetical protein [Streptomyces sp. NBRC 110611]GAU65324.1 integral membrane protein MviN [Streptomyces sp. NBRC 110611]